MIKLTGYVNEQGKFEPDDGERFRQVFIKNKDKRVELWVNRESYKRSVQFNRLYFGVLARTLAEYMGVPVHQAHFWLKYHTIGVDQIPNPETGEMIYVEKRTRDMTNDEFRDFVRDAEIWMLEKGVIEMTQLQE